MANIVITGSAGFIGKYLSVELAKSHNVIGLDKKTGHDLHWLTNFPPADVVFHLAAQTSVIDSVADPFADAADNILLTVKVLQAYPDSKIIYTASGGASEQEELASPYGISKGVAGAYLELLHKNAVICNLSNVFGKGGKGVIERFIAEPTLTVYGNGRQTRDFVHVDDVVKGLIMATGWPVGTYNMGAGKEVSVLDLAEATNKYYRFEPERKGEIFRSVLNNITPDWTPKIDVLEYLAREAGSYGE